MTENLFVIMNYGYNNGEFREGTDPVLTAASTGTDGSIVGNRIPFTPEHSFVFSFDTDTQFSSTMDAFLRGDFIYESDRAIQQGNFNSIGERKLVNLRTGLRTDKWTLSFYVRNLLDDDTPLSALEFKNFTDPDQFDSPNPALDGRDNSVLPNMWALNPQRERDWGAEFQFRFGN